MNATDGITLTTEEAVVTTAQVQIKTLTVKGRQVTLALFRQLKNEQVVDWDTVAARGPVWGHVNYHSGCSSSSGHTHLVWQSGNELRTCTVAQEHGRQSSAFDELKERRTDALQRLLAAKALARYVYKGGVPEHTATELDTDVVVRPYGDSDAYPGAKAAMKLFTLNAEEFKPRKVSLYSGPPWDREPNEAEAADQKAGWEEYHNKSRMEAILEIQREWPDIQSVARETETAQMAVARCKDFLTRWDVLYAQLLQPPQLFIAV